MKSYTGVYLYLYSIRLISIRPIVVIVARSNKKARLNVLRIDWHGRQEMRRVISCRSCQVLGNCCNEIAFACSKYQIAAQAYTRLIASSRDRLRNMRSSFRKCTTRRSHTKHQSHWSDCPITKVCSCTIRVLCPEKRGHSILGITLTNLDTVS